MTTVSGLWPSFSTYFPLENAQEVFKLPTKKEAEDVFFGLGAKFWLQIIDGKFHQHGERVFDDGLHDPNKKEPGFLSSLKSGCQFAASCLTEDLSVSFYKSLHKKLCAHFKGEENNVLMDSSATGKFRDSAEAVTRCRLAISLFVSEAKLLKTKDLVTQGDHLAAHYSYMESWNECKEKCSKLNQGIMMFSNRFQIPAFTWISASPDTGIQIEYRCVSSQDHKKIIKCIFDDYKGKTGDLNFKLNRAFQESEINALMLAKIEAIADLFQKLEWLHPFQDGQGRTDLVLLAKLLSEEGLNPAILQEPYFSTYSSLNEWKEYLIEGMEQWKKVKKSESIGKCS